jgi:cobaltochelatase CobS
VYFLAFEKMTISHFMDCILKAPKDAEIITNQIKEEDFIATLFDCYMQQADTLAEAAKYKATSSTTSFKAVEMPALDERAIAAIDGVLKGFSAPGWEEIKKTFNAVGELSKATKLAQATLKKATEASEAEQTRLRKIVADLNTKLSTSVVQEMKVEGSGEIPNGKVTMKSAKEIFPGIETDFMVPFWEWDGVHPEVPKVDEFYIFRDYLLIRSLYAIVSNQRMYLQGHTGSGKTTLVEQIAARLNWPFMRINFDSEITRMDLIGRDTLKDGKSVFVDGVLPRMMSGPYISVFDEIDFCRPDVAYVMQSVLEGNSFRITEDGGREVKPHPMFRMFATGNTVGQGDEHGMYQGARPQSLAFLDRFQIWGKVPYLNEEERKELIKRQYPALEEQTVGIINKYATEHLTAFVQGNVLQPISPRGILALAKAVSHLSVFNAGKTKVMKEAITMTILDRCTSNDYAVLKGVVDRVIK